MQLQHWHFTRHPPPSQASTTNTLSHQEQLSTINDKESHSIWGIILLLGENVAHAVALVADTSCRCSYNHGVAGVKSSACVALNTSEGWVHSWVVKQRTP